MWKGLSELVPDRRTVKTGSGAFLGLYFDLAVSESSKANKKKGGKLFY